MLGKVPEVCVDVGNSCFFTIDAIKIAIKMGIFLHHIHMRSADNLCFAASVADAGVTSPPLKHM